MRPETRRPRLIGLRQRGEDSLNVRANRLVAIVGLTALACQSNPGDVDAAADAGKALWYWGDSNATENKSVAFVGYDQGCSQFQELADVEGGVSYRVGFALQKSAADRLKHYDGSANQEAVDDGSLAGYAVVGTVLLISAAKEQFDAQGDSITTPLAPILRVAGARPGSATEASFTGSLNVPGGNPCAPADRLCRAKVEPTFVVVWQQAETGVRAYQFLRPQKQALHLFEPGHHSDCPVRSEAEFSFRQGLGVAWPLRQDFAVSLEGAPEPSRWTGWIDEVLPR